MEGWLHAPMRGVPMAAVSLLRVKAKLLFASRRLKFATAICFAAITVVFLQGLSRFWAHDTGELPSAAVGWMGNYESMHTYLWVFCVLLIMPILACSLYGDVLLQDTQTARLPALVSRTSPDAYIVSSALLVFLSSFLFVLLFELVSQLMAFFVFPVQADVDSFQIGYLSNAAEMETRMSYLSRLPFGPLAGMNPYLFNAAYMLYDAFYMGVMALLSFAISLFVRRGSLLVLAFPTALLLLSSQVLPVPINPTSSLLISVSHAEGQTLLLTLLAPVCLLVLCVGAILVHQYIVRGDYI